MIAAGLAILLAQVPASTAAPASHVQRPATILLPAGTAVRLATTGAIDSRSVIQGQRFGLRFAEDVMVGSTVAIPRDTAAVGEVEAVSGTGMFGKAGRLVLQPLFVDIAGERVNLVGSTSEKGEDSVTAAAITTAITPFGLFITGKRAIMPPGSILLGRVRTDVTLPASSAHPAATVEQVPAAAKVAAPTASRP